LNKNSTILKTLFIIFLAIYVFQGCSGRTPESTWTAVEYFKYAKEKYDDEDYFDAVNEFTVVSLRYPGSSVADSAQFYLGMCHFHMDEFIISAAEFNKLIEEMPKSPLVAEALLMMGESYYQISPRAELDQEYSIKAIKEFQLFLEDFPTHAKKEDVERKIYELREKQAEKQWRNAEIYRKMRKLKASIIYYDIVLSNFYDTEYADDSQLGKALVYIELEEWKNAKRELLFLKEKYQDSILLKEAEELLSEVKEAEAEANEEEEG